MKRLIAASLAASLLLAIAAPVLATSPGRGCPNESSGWNEVDAQGWWDRSVEGFELAGIPVYVGGDPAGGFTAEFEAFAVSIGFADAQAFYEVIVGPQFEGFDKNGDGFVCMKPAQIVPWNPGYFFFPIDNASNAGH